MFFSSQPRKERTPPCLQTRPDERNFLCFLSYCAGLAVFVLVLTQLTVAKGTSRYATNTAIVAQYFQIIQRRQQFSSNSGGRQRTEQPRCAWPSKVSSASHCSASSAHANRVSRRACAQLIGCTKEGSPCIALPRRRTARDLRGGGGDHFSGGDSEPSALPPR